MRNVKILLRGVFDAAACDECVTEPALKDFCQMACHSRHTYLYTQAVIDQLIRTSGQRFYMLFVQFSAVSHAFPSVSMGFSVCFMRFSAAEKR